MANQIAMNFGTMGDVDAVAATADHIAMFWDPRMKASVLADTMEALLDTVLAERRGEPVSGLSLV